jgi:hypothetical protein
MRIATSYGRPRPGTGARRGGAIMTVELLFVVPIVLIVLFGVGEFHMLTSTRISLLNASRAGARVAVSGTYANKQQVNDEVRRTVREALGTGRLSRSSHVAVTWSQDLPAKETMGQADWVHVRVDVRARSVIPDVLGMIGFTLGSKQLVGATLMKQE